MLQYLSLNEHFNILSSNSLSISSSPLLLSLSIYCDSLFHLSIFLFLSSSPLFSLSYSLSPPLHLLLSLSLFPPSISSSPLLLSLSLSCDSLSLYLSIFLFLSSSSLFSLSYSLSPPLHLKQSLSLFPPIYFSLLPPFSLSSLMFLISL